MHQNDKFGCNGLNLYNVRPNGTPETESKDYKTKNSCSASPKIGEIGTFQEPHVMVATLVKDWRNRYYFLNHTVHNLFFANILDHICLLNNLEITQSEYNN